MIHRYEPGHGKGGEYMGMEETPEGHWCAHEDVAALEERLATREISHAEKRRLLHNELEQLKHQLATERAAHEATKAQLVKAERIWAIDRDARAAAEARVAELEARGQRVGEEVSRICGERVQAYSERDVARAAIDRARGLLERASHAVDTCEPEGVRDVWFADYGDWLRANPATAIPAEQREQRLQAQGFEPVTEQQRAENRLVNLGQATPATGAELADVCLECAVWPCVCRKEQKT